MAFRYPAMQRKCPHVATAELQIYNVTIYNGVPPWTIVLA
jgi:hypothetical protein